MRFVYYFPATLQRYKLLPKKDNVIHESYRFPKKQSNRLHSLHTFQSRFSKIKLPEKDTHHDKITISEEIIKKRRAPYKRQELK